MSINAESHSFGPGYGGFGGFGGGGFGAIGLVGLIGLDSLRGRRDGDGDGGSCANARFLALENGISQTQDMIANQNVLGAIKDSATASALRFDAVQNNIDAVQTQLLLGAERTNDNIAEVKFQNALNFQALGKQMSDCCCEIKEAVHSDGESTRALITANTIQDLRDKLAASQNCNQTQAITTDNLKQTHHWEHLLLQLSHQCARQGEKIDNIGSIVIGAGNLVGNKTNTGGLQG